MTFLMYYMYIFFKRFLMDCLRKHFVICTVACDNDYGIYFLVRVASISDITTLALHPTRTTNDGCGTSHGF